MKGTRTKKGLEGVILRYKLFFLIQPEHTRRLFEGSNFTHRVMHIPLDFDAQRADQSRRYVEQNLLPASADDHNLTRA